MNAVLTTTPGAISDQILAFCKTIDPNQEPVYVPVRPEGFSNTDDCYINVRAKIKRSGGGQQFGWTIWETKHVMLDAEFHAVWVSPKSTFVDVTQKIDKETQILFLPDTTRRYEGNVVDNIRHPLVDDPKVEELIAIKRRLFEIKRPYMIDDGTPGPLCTEFPKNVEREMEQLESRLPAILCHMSKIQKGK